MVECFECVHFRPWANRQHGECTLSLPPWVPIDPERFVLGSTTRRYPVMKRVEGCDLGTKKSPS